MKNKLSVKIDAREKDRIRSSSEYYKKQGLEVEVAELPVGDYIFTNGTDSVVFEFKLISDFVSSIQSNRVFNQAISQAEEFNHHFVVIFGDLYTRNKCIAMSRNYREVNVFQYIGAISSINRYSTVLQVYSPYIEEAYITMQKQAEKCLSDKPIVKKFPKKHKNTALNFLMYTVYGISTKKAMAIVETLDLHTLTDLQNLTTDKLLEIEGIGPKNARAIMEAIK